MKTQSGTLYSTIHSILQNIIDNPISIGKAREVLLSSSGFNIPIGSTIYDILKEMEQLNLIRIDDNIIEVMEW